MNLKDFEKQVEPKIVQRGLDYFKNGDVRKVEKVSADEYSATVFGSQLYTVFVKLDGEKIAEYECDCPYDFGDTCKHAVAVFYKLRANDYTDSAEKFKQILDGVNDNALRDFVQTLLKKDRRFRNEFFSTFDEDFEVDEDEEFFDEDYY